MRRELASLCALAVLSVSKPAEAILGLGHCIERNPMTVVVDKGDTLGRLAEKYYGDSSFYKAIADHNNITNPDLIIIGQNLELPHMYSERKRLVSVADGLGFGEYCTIHDVPLYRPF
jgi:hypothetical protein